MDVDLPPKKEPFWKRHRRMIIAALLIVVFGLVGNWYIKQSTKKEPIQTASIVDSLRAEETSLNEDGPVARVNGEDIPRVAYKNRLKEITEALTRQRFNTANAKIAAEIRQQAIAELVNFTLLYQVATDAGFRASKADIDAAYQTVLTDMGSEEVLLLVLKDRDLTTADLREELKRQVVVDAYIASTANPDSVVVTDAEVEQYHANISANNPETDVLENIEDELRALLRAQKQQQLVTDLIQDLRANAEIEVLI